MRSCCSGSTWSDLAQPLGTTCNCIFKIFSQTEVSPKPLLLLLLPLRDDTTKMTGHFDGYVEVHSKDEVAVMEALMKHGPLAVGVDASFDEFLFYS